MQRSIMPIRSIIDISCVIPVYIRLIHGRHHSELWGCPYNCTGGQSAGVHTLSPGRCDNHKSDLQWLCPPHPQNRNGSKHKGPDPISKVFGGVSWCWRLYCARLSSPKYAPTDVEPSPGNPVSCRVPESNTIRTTIYDQEMSYGQTVKPTPTTNNVAHLFI